MKDMRLNYLFNLLCIHSQPTTTPSQSPSKGPSVSLDEPAPITPSPTVSCDCSAFQQAGKCSCPSSPNWQADPIKTDDKPPGACAREKCCFCQENFLQPDICKRDSCEGEDNVDFPTRRKLQAATIPRLSRNLKVCTTENVLNYSPTTEYEPGDVVRIGTKRYKCKDSPNGLWCKIPAYAPAESDYWEQAWMEDGTCPPPSGSSE